MKRANVCAPLYRTEAEAWQCVVDLLTSGEMPPYTDGGLCVGLCMVVCALFLEGAIPSPVYGAMRDRICTEMDRREVYQFGPWGQVGQRLGIAHDFLIAATREGV